jgi:hypothetical protein
MAEKPKILAITPAGPDHQVVTVSGGPTGRYCKKPCAQCPWRIDQTGKFPAEAFEHSARTAYDMDTHTFACHMAGAESPATCAGFLLRGSTHNMSVRISLMRGNIDLRSVSDGDNELHPNYRQMAEANGVDPNSPALKKCRDDV